MAGLSAQTNRRAGAVVNRDDAFGVQAAHDIRRFSAGGMAPERPKDGRQFRMAGLVCEVAYSSEEGFVRAEAGVEPVDPSLRRRRSPSFKNVVAWTEQGAVPLFGQGLPVQVVSGSGAFPGGRHARAVLVNDDAARMMSFYAVRNPERVGDGDSQFPLYGLMPDNPP